MSLFNTMRTATSGMQAQSNALSTIGDNIANSGTTGYKKATAEFETALGINATSEYESGGVQTDVRYGITSQGTLTSSASATDLGINGNGFFVVSKDGQGQYLTRAGSFVPDSNGNLVNAAGYELMGYEKTASGMSTSLSVVNVSSTALNAQSSTTGTLTANLPSTATAVTGDLPSSNKADATYSDKTSVTAYDSLGKADVLDVYLTKTGDNTWEATAYHQADAASGGGFPYSSAAVGVSNMTFDATTGALKSTTTPGTDASGNATSTATTPANTLNVDLGGKTSIPIDLSSTTQLASDFAVNQASADGYAASKLSKVTIGQNGTVTNVYASGAQVATYKIPLGTVTSPDNLTPLSGNVYQVSENSGTIVTADANSSGLGSINSGELESSTVDLATELTNMIQAQRGYEANSKVLQAGSDLLGVLNRLTTN